MLLHVQTIVYVHVDVIIMTNYHTSMYIVSEFYDIKIDVINGVPSSECTLSLVRYLNRSTHKILTCTDLAPGNGQAEAPLTITNPAPAELVRFML